MDEQEISGEELAPGQDPRVLDLLAHYAASEEDCWLIRKDCAETPPGPRFWNKLHGILVAGGLLEPGLPGPIAGEIPTPGYRATRAGRQEAARHAKGRDS